MLWFRMGAVIALIFTFCMSIAIFLSVFVMCVNPANGRAMNSDPYYNGTLFYYILVLIAEILMGCASFFGFVVAFKAWKNNHQMDHTLRHLFTLWLAILGLAIAVIFMLGIMGLVKYRETQEEITSLYEIFTKYNQDIKFVGSFERYQRENSCCGINSPDDWMMAQFKSSGGYGGSGGSFDSSYMGSPSTGKCHLTPPTVPMGCGKKISEDIHFTMTLYAGVIILQTMGAIAAASLGWYCFFYWIEKEVIIIPEDEVSNLIVIEPESSISTVYTTESESGSRSGSYRSGSGSIFSGSRSRSLYSRSGSGSRYSRTQSYLPTSREYLGSRFTYNGYSGSKSFYPNSGRTSGSGGTKFSNFTGAIPSIGGPHSRYLGSIPDEEILNHNNEDQTPLEFPPHHSAHAKHSKLLGANGIVATRQSSKSSKGYYGPGSRATASKWGSRYPESATLHHGRYGRPVHYDGSGSTRSGSASTRSGSTRTGSYMRGSSYISSGSRMGSSFIKSKSHHKKKVKKVHSKNHMLHLQEKALGGRVLAEMHVDHSRDPDPMNSHMDVSAGHHGHRPHHATIALIKNKNPKRPKSFWRGSGTHAHGQTGHVAEDIVEMSGAAAVKSLVDDINLPVEHDPHLAEGSGYVNKLHKAKKNKSQLDHPDPDHPGHGAVHNKNGKLSAPSIDGSQAQVLVDALLSAEPKPKPKEPPVKVHEIEEEPGNDVSDHKHHHHNDHHHHHNHGTKSHLASRHHAHGSDHHHHHLGSGHNHHHHGSRHSTGSTSHHHHHGSGHKHHHHGSGHDHHHHLGSGHNHHHHHGSGHDHHNHHNHDHHHHRHGSSSRGSLETEVLYKTERSFS